MIWLISCACLILAALAYWLLVTAEGAYLGPRVVAWTYDLFARRYDRAKAFDSYDDDHRIALPLMLRLADVESPLILDVATGTGRVPMSLTRSGFDGNVIGVDLSREMLRVAQDNLKGNDRVVLLRQDATRLPFSDGAFDAVTCLEALEFFPAPRLALAEMVRVLAPGGTLMVSNRVGWLSSLLPGKAFPRRAFWQALHALRLRDIVVRSWEPIYDLAVGYKEVASGQG